MQQKSYWSKYCLNRKVLRLGLKAGPGGSTVTESERKRIPDSHTVHTGLLAGGQAQAIRTHALAAVAWQRNANDVAAAIVVAAAV